ncbi:GFA family protein [Aliiroseovarius sp.]|uniref:GFA family protein n=1 Tax=Aliiroseovarius sp. TaxID=1872442 RepID=UPI003BA87E8E
MTQDHVTGHCLCGETSFTYRPPERFMVHCHCESCRRATASGFTSFIGVRDGQWRWTGRPVAQYQSSPGVHRSFCSRCGTQMAFQSAKYPGEIHFYAATLSDPTHFKPTTHVHTDEMLSWIHLDDGLPQK